MKTKIIIVLISTLLILTSLPSMGTVEEKIFTYNCCCDIVPGKFIVKFSDNKAVKSPLITALNEKHKIYSVESWRKTQRRKYTILQATEGWLSKWIGPVKRIRNMP